MVQSYSPGGGNVLFHEGTLAPPGEYDWTCASFGPLESTTQTANRSVQPFLHNSPQKLSAYTLQWAPLSTRIAPSHGDSHVTHDALGPCEPTSSQTALRSDRFSCVCTNDRRVSLVYNGIPVPPLKIAQISCKSVHFRQSYTRTREHRQNRPKVFPIFSWSPTSSRIIMLMFCFVLF